MIDNFANCIDTARSRARILTLVSYASSIGCTIGVDYALGSTTLVWISVEIGQTNAGHRIENLATHCVCTTRRWLARI